MYSPIRVLFLCTGNSARSQMAEGFLRALGSTDFEVFSAGTLPKGLHPLAVQVMAEHHLDISHQISKDVDEFVGQHFDFIITVCDRARDHCPTFPEDTVKIHWSYPDPAAVEGSEEQRLKAFRDVARELKERLRAWVAIQRKRLIEQEGR